MKKLLIISPHFPPVNAPDMQRVRQALPYLAKCGWEPTIVAIAPEFVAGATLDFLLESAYPPGIRIVRVRGIPPGLTKPLGFDNLWLRCGAAVRRAAEHLLATERFDAVLFSTTQFSAFSLGPRWRDRFAVPYILDYQDPWVNDYYHRSGVPPPGGRLKFGLSQWSARRREPRAVGHAAAILSVSPAYIADLCTRYPTLDRSRLHVLPFGVEPADFSLALREPPPRPLFDFTDGFRHAVYVGRCVAGMQPALRAFFRAFRRHQESSPGVAERWRFHFVGTDYAPPPRSREWVSPLAREEGVADFVTEHTGRVPYFEALYYLRNADALLAIGSDDSSYNASKLFPYLLARRPLLLVFHPQSPVRELSEQVGSGIFVGCAGTSGITPAAAEILDRWFNHPASSTVPPFNEARLGSFTAEVLTRRLAGILEQSLVG